MIVESKELLDQDKTALFTSLVQQETNTLIELAENGLLSNEEEWEIGLELEGWFLDKSLKPKPFAPEMVRALNQPELSEEIAKDVFEINLKPLVVKANFLTRFDDNLTAIYRQCNEWAKENEAKIVTIGMLPHIPPEHFTEALLTNNLRTQLLNASLLQLRNQQPWAIKISGEDTLQLLSHSICLEAATTSTQFHLKVPYQQLADTYNRAQILAAPMVAMSANAPFFNGHSLWHDTRIPLVQQSVSEQLPPSCWFNTEDRVLFGSQYVEHSIMQLFKDNLDFSALIPWIDHAQSPQFHHLKTHNGSIWRWNRPVLGQNSPNETMHIRIEHRVQSAGTSPCDIAAQLGFYIGILAYWEENQIKAQTMMPFYKARANFYQAAKQGLEASIFWGGSKPLQLLDVIRTQLLPQAKLGLQSLGLAQEEISFYMDEVLGERLKKGWSGAIWQRLKVKEYGEIQQMLECYQENQQALKPLWRW